ncbi:MAG: hypothetical protein U9R36_01915 [Elusimicrobiota bacterium]|nr:hypothetical protein [Elusimicrobiota bacterium]
MTRRTLFGTLWGIILILCAYLLTALFNLPWNFSPGLSIGTAIISGGLMGLIIGSNEMAPSGGAIAGGLIVGLIFTLLGSFTADSRSFLLFFISGVAAGAIAGALCAVFVHKVRFE